MPRNYYNEFDPKAAAWLRELIALGEIPDGDVDERSIVDVKPGDLRGYTQCHFFAGIAGWPEALRLAGWPEDRPVWTGSCPCQPYSAAGKGLGDADPRNLWPVFANLIRECRPVRVCGEQVASAIGHGWLDGVRADLERAGYAVGAAVLGAHSVGAPHIRQRLYWVADCQRLGCDWRPNAREPAGKVSAERGQGLPDIERGRDAGRLADDNMWRCVEPVNGCEHCARSREEQPPRSSAPSRLADSQHDGGRADEPGRESQGRTADGRACWLADSPSGGQLIDRGAQREAGHPDQRGEIGGMGDADHAGPQGRRQRVGRAGELHSGQASAWSDFDILPCRDGKSRRVESGAFPLVAGLPKGVVPSGDPGDAEVQSTAEARVVRLRGYGNAIVPAVAAAFLIASMDA